MQKRLQNKVAESWLTLPFMLLVTILSMVLHGWLRGEGWLAAGVLLLSAYFMVELNNRNALLRMPSRLVSSFFLLFSVISMTTTVSIAALLAQFAFICCLLMLFASYMDRNAPHLCFYAFAAISIMSVWEVELLILVPLLWPCQALYFRHLTWRNFIAGLLGCMMPYWIILGWWTFHGHPEMLLTHFAIDEGVVGLGELSIWSLAYITLWFIIGAVYFLRNNFLDNIRIRMLYYFFCFMGTMLLILLLVFHAWRDVFEALYIVCAAPLAAHYVAHTSSKVSNVVSIVMTLLAVGLLFIIH